MPADALGMMSSMTGVPHAVALAIVLAAASALRLAWRKLFVRSREPGKIDRWLAEYTATPVFLLIVAAGAEVIFGRLAELPEVHKLPVTPYINGATYIATILSVTWVVYGLLKGSSQWYLSRIALRTGSTLDTDLAPAFGLAMKVLLIFIAA
ncbi:MAG TPA: hypothetical protein VEU62_07585, partial [Bryobacterales bacterium]|nr:hypothetical protein [Bryobacterales bacterium]